MWIGCGAQKTKSSHFPLFKSATATQQQHNHKGQGHRIAQQSFGMPAKRKDDKVQDEERDFVGVYVFPDGATYDGQLWKKENCAPIRHGNGVFTDVGCVYDGQWRDDVMAGEGTMQFSSGACYIGTFYSNKFNGKGRYTWPDGSYYEGEWRGNLMHGHGTFVDSAGRKWVGRFYDGVGESLLLECE